jgi:preprotein translocase subunit SecE
MNSIRNYLSEVFVELKKANSKEKGFAKYKELTDSTLVVFVAMLLLGAFVSTFDTLLRGSFQALIDTVAK